MVEDGAASNLAVLDVNAGGRRLIGVLVSGRIPEMELQLAFLVQLRRRYATDRRADGAVLKAKD